MTLQRILLAAAGLAVAAGPLALGVVNVPWLRAQPPSDQPLAFEVVSIKKVVLPPGKAIFHFRGTDVASRALKPAGNRFAERMVTLSDLVIAAYDVDDYQISGLPNWALPNQDLYDLDARSEGEAAPTSDQLRLMLRTMLADRFQLKVHRETRDLPVYYLAVGKNGLKMKEVVPDDGPPAGEKQGSKDVPASVPVRPAGDPSAGRVIQGGIGGFLQLISIFLDHPVIDKTGLTGKYEYVWASQDLLEELRQGKPAPSIFATVQQFGLRLDATKGPVDVLFVDHAEKPSAN